MDDGRGYLGDGRGIFLRHLVFPHSDFRFLFKDMLSRSAEINRKNDFAVNCSRFGEARMVISSHAESSSRPILLCLKICWIVAI